MDKFNYNDQGYAHGLQARNSTMESGETLSEEEAREYASELFFDANDGDMYPATPTEEETAYIDGFIRGFYEQWFPEPAELFSEL